MQTPVQIDFQGMQASAQARVSIEEHVAQLEQCYGRVTACQVVVKGPGGHHRTGGPYEVHIRLAMVAKAGWEHFPHDADVGVRGWGATAAQAFELSRLLGRISPEKRPDRAISIAKRLACV